MVQSRCKQYFGFILKLVCTISTMDNDTNSERKLTEAQKARIERNRIKALSLRSAKIVPRLVWIVIKCPEDIMNLYTLAPMPLKV